MLYSLHFRVIFIDFESQIYFWLPAEYKYLKWKFLSLEFNSWCCHCLSHSLFLSFSNEMYWFEIFNFSDIRIFRILRIVHVFFPFSQTKLHFLAVFFPLRFFVLIFCLVLLRLCFLLKVCEYREFYKLFYMRCSVGSWHPWTLRHWPSKSMVF